MACAKQSKKNKRTESNCVTLTHVQYASQKNKPANKTAKMKWEYWNKQERKKKQQQSSTLNEKNNNKIEFMNILKWHISMASVHICFSQQKKKRARFSSAFIQPFTYSAQHTSVFNAIKSTLHCSISSLSRYVAIFEHSHQTSSSFRALFSPFLWKCSVLYFFLLSSTLWQ